VIGNLVTKCYIVHEPGKTFELAAELANLVLVCEEIRGQRGEVKDHHPEIGIPGLKPGSQVSYLFMGGFGWYERERYWHPHLLHARCSYWVYYQWQGR
jgi:hypothetical protein